MKKLILLLSVCLLSISVQAQYQFGLFAGTNYSQPKFDFIKASEAKVGYQLGVANKYFFRDLFAISCDLQWMNRGFQRTERGGGFVVPDGNGFFQFIPPYDLTRRYRLHYLEILQQIEGDVSEQLSIGIGINMGFLLVGRVNSISREGSNIFSTYEGLEFKRMNYGIHASARLEFGEVFLLLRYNYGLDSIIDNNVLQIGLAGRSLSKTSVRNQTLELNIGYYLN